MIGHMKRDVLAPFEHSRHTSPIVTSRYFYLGTNSTWESGW